MIWFLLKQYAALLLGGINLVLLFWAITAYRRKANLPDVYVRLLPVSAVLTSLLLGVGLWFLFRGLQPDLMHVIYGTLVSLGALGQALLARGTALSQRYRGKPLVHAFLALFVMLLTVRAYMSS